MVGKCPNTLCNSNLNELQLFETGSMRSTFRLNEKIPNVVITEDDMFIPDATWNDKQWLCPFCGVLIATNEKEAIKFLKGV